MTTSTDHSSRRGLLARAKRGFTLAEVLVTLTLSGVVLAASTGSLLFLAKSSRGMTNYQEMNLASRFTLEEFASDARMTVNVVSASSTAVALEVYNSVGSTTNVTYAYNAGAGTFTRTVGGATQVLLEDVEELELNYFTLRRDPTTTPLEIKEIQLQAVMKRNALSIANTNEIISARFMMRNRAVST